jgi:hypothetical protein
MCLGHCGGQCKGTVLLLHKQLISVDIVYHMLSVLCILINVCCVQRFGLFVGNALYK